MTINPKWAIRGASPVDGCLAADKAGLGVVSGGDAFAGPTGMNLAPDGGSGAVVVWLAPKRGTAGASVHQLFQK